MHAWWCCTTTAAVAAAAAAAVAIHVAADTAADEKRRRGVRIAAVVSLATRTRPDLSEDARQFPSELRTRELTCLHRFPSSSSLPPLPPSFPVLLLPPLWAHHGTTALQL
eukprot:GHVU01105540.1.p5 GENE.GHVU01105540.1~~GHVU01105540.1.p5  ORF type:complete len:110 (-),score=19.14 GHVU01105540.1:199-528(-)